MEFVPGSICVSISKKIYLFWVFMDDKENGKFEWIKQHADTIILLSTICAGLLWMNGKFNDLEKDIAVIKTVLVMKATFLTFARHAE